MTDTSKWSWLVRTLSIAFAGTAISALAWAQGREPFHLSIELVDPHAFRVCADPHNLPFSNEQGAGFENKLAELFADKLAKKLSYAWHPQATGFVRNTLGAHRCDVIMGYPQGDDLVQSTNPYYRTAYALIFKSGSDLEGISSLADERLKQKRIGVVAGTPPASYLAINGLLAKMKPYALMVDTRFDSSAEAMVKDLKARRDRCRCVVGSDGRFLCPAGQSIDASRAALEGDGRAAPSLSHRHGRTSLRPELEA